MDYGYITQGKLYLSRNGGKPEQVSSEFAEQVRRQHQKAVERNSWKTGGGENGLGMSPWNVRPENEATALARILSAAPSPVYMELFYSLRTASVGGLFKCDTEDLEETRLFHKESLDLTDLDHHPERDELACSVSDGDGRSIAVVSNARFDIQHLTEGDSYDTAPSWVPEKPDTLVYQSSGIGRSQNGYFIQLNHSVIESLDAINGAQETLLEDESFDFMSPRMDAQGNLYCIRRPFKSMSAGPSHGQALKDFLLIPFRLLKALYGFLDVITRIFGKQSLVNATTGKKQEVGLKELYVKGRLVDISKNDSKEDEQSLVPASWELIKVEASGATTVLRKSVCDFHLDPDEGIIATDGYRVFSIKDGKETRLFKGKEIIDKVFIL